MDEQQAETDQSSVDHAAQNHDDRKGLTENDGHNQNEKDQDQQETQAVQSAAKPELAERAKLFNLVPR